ncbi:hypothetical protein H477_1405 [[Clostridium] sordellii ATCC 9714]|nr:hypothetical protein H477_1405 [[Clostridium] sordellii ATCC 9714] [Paeniclostridium sordellii ATCC 9714]
MAATNLAMKFKKAYIPIILTIDIPKNIGLNLIKIAKDT